MAGGDLFRRTLAAAWVRPEALNVTPDLLGMPLAPHGRRLLAMGVDLGLVGALSTTGMFWAVAGVGALAIQLRRPAPARPRARSVLMWLALAALVGVAVMHGVQWVQQRDAPGGGAVARSLDDEDEDDADTAPAAASAPAPAASLPAALLPDARIRELEAQLAEARKPRPVQWRNDAMRQWHRLGLRFGWAVAYFSLLPVWWKGQTLGKRLFGLRVVELTGKPLTPMSGFGRYGGYAAGLATGGIGFLQVLWDPNRQAVQDKLAHTVVVDLRGPRAPVIPGPGRTADDRAAT